MDGIELTELEQDILERSSDPSVTKRRMVAVALFGFLAAIGMVITTYSGVSRTVLGWIAVIYICLTIREKLGYGVAVLGYKSLIQKLLRRIDVLSGSSHEDDPSLDDG